MVHGKLNDVGEQVEIQNPAHYVAHRSIIQPGLEPCLQIILICGVHNSVHREQYQMCKDLPVPCFLVHPFDDDEPDRYARSELDRTMARFPEEHIQERNRVRFESMRNNVKQRVNAPHAQDKGYPSLRNTRPGNLS